METTGGCVWGLAGFNAGVWTGFTGAGLLAATDLSGWPGAVPSGVLFVISGAGDDVLILARDLLSKEVMPFCGGSFSLAGRHFPSSTSRSDCRRYVSRCVWNRSLKSGGVLDFTFSISVTMTDLLPLS